MTTNPCSVIYYAVTPQQQPINQCIWKQSELTLEITSKPCQCILLKTYETDPICLVSQSTIDTKQIWEYKLSQIIGSENVALLFIDFQRVLHLRLFVAICLYCHISALFQFVCRYLCLHVCLFKKYKTSFKNKIEKQFEFILQLYLELSDAEIIKKLVSDIVNVTFNFFQG